MSRIGKQPINIPTNVAATCKDLIVTVKGPKGELAQTLVPGISVTINDGLCTVSRETDTPRDRAFHGLYRQLIHNMMQGVSKGFSRELLLHGIGYKVQLQDKNLHLSLGYSIPIEFEAPQDIVFSVEGDNKIIVSGIDKQRVGQIAAQIRSIRPPEVYKGKGIRFAGEEVRLKAGKAGIK